MVNQSWWKILGVSLIVYSLIAGMLIPLGTGVYNVSPSNAEVGNVVSLDITGYNTHYTQTKSEDVRAWLKIGDDYAIAAKKISITGDQKMSAVFAIPNHLPTAEKVEPTTLIIDDPVNGPHIMPSAVFISQVEPQPSYGVQLWQSSPIENINEEPRLSFPFRSVIYESIRNTFYHVPMWFAMMVILLASVIQSVQFLRTKNMEYDKRSVALTTAGTFFGFVGLGTGMVWAQYSWGAAWSGDIKQNMTAIALLIYLAYFVLRSSFEDEETRGRISAVYNIFAFATLIPLLYVVPRMVASLHPGSGGNPAFGSEDLDSTMRMIFYPAIIGWILFGVWIASIHLRYLRLKERILEKEF